MSIYIAFHNHEQLNTEIRQFYMELVITAWERLIIETKRQLLDHSNSTDSHPLKINEILIDCFENDMERVSHFNRTIRQTILDSLIFVKQSPGTSYTIKNCVFFHPFHTGPRNKEELIWELAHELCHSFGAGHSFEGIMSKPYSTDAEWIVDTQTAFTLQFTAFYKRIEDIQTIYKDYVMNSMMKKLNNNRKILKFTCIRSGPRSIYLLDSASKYLENITYVQEEKCDCTLELLNEVTQIVIIFFDGNREFLSVPV